MNHIDDAVLADYRLGSDDEPVEEHLLACDFCAHRLRDIISLAEGVRNVVRAGALRMIVSDAVLERAAAEGLRIRQYAIPAGGSVECTVTAGDDILIGRMAVGVTGGKRVDLCFYDERGVEQVRLADIPIQAGAAAVVYQESITFAKASPDCKMIARLITFNGAGGETLVGEYTFNHTRSMPVE